MWKKIDGMPHKVNCLGEVYTPVNNRMLNTKGVECYSLSYKGKVVQRTKTSLLREYFPYEWIKYLDDDETAKPLYGGKYFVTDKGRVWSMRTWKWLSIFQCVTGHTTYYYGVNMNTTHHYIHQVVGRTFLPEYKEGLHILHKDETLCYPNINYLDNLWVGTHQDNMTDMSNKGRQGRCGGRPKKC